MAKLLSQLVGFTKISSWITFLDVMKMKVQIFKP